MFRTWLGTSTNPCRKELLIALRTKAVNEIAIAKEYEKQFIKTPHPDIDSSDTRSALISSNVLRSNHAKLCILLNGSEPTLLSLTAELYAKGIIDMKVQIDVLKKGGYVGADILLTHVQMKIEQSPEHLNIVQKAMEN